MLVYGEDAKIPFETNTSSWRHSHFNKEENEVGLRCVGDLIDKIRDVACIQEFVVKRRAYIRYNSKIIQREMHEGDLVK